jgi:hypothetical protein
MANVNVHRYKIYSNEQGIPVDTKISVYATLEKIRQLGATPIMASVLAVDELELNAAGFYHPRQ